MRDGAGADCDRTSAFNSRFKRDPTYVRKSSQENSVRKERNNWFEMLSRKFCQKREEKYEVKKTAFQLGYQTEAAMIYLSIDCHTPRDDICHKQHLC